MATETHKPLLTVPKDFKCKWSVNPMKLNLAYTHLVWHKESNPSFEITEEKIKEQYVLLKGLLKEDMEKNLKIKRPRSTSNIE